MRWVMRAKNFTIAASIALWWVLVNLPWLVVGAEEFTGGQLVPVMNLLPAIALTALFISLYGKFRRSLLLAVAVILALGGYLTITTDLTQSSVVIAELERLSGVMNAQSHQAGVEVSGSWARIAAFASAIVASVITLFGLRAKSTAEVRQQVATESIDNRSLWDEQN